MGCEHGESLLGGALAAHLGPDEHAGQQNLTPTPFVAKDCRETVDFDVPHDDRGGDRNGGVRLTSYTTDSMVRTEPSGSLID